MVVCFLCVVFGMPVRARYSRLMLAVMLLAASIACARTEATPDSAGSRAASGATESAPAVPVMTARVEVRTVPVILTSVGTVETIATVEIRSQVTGQIRAIHFTPGQEVRKGQLLFALDARSFEAAERQAEAVVARDVAQATDAKAQRARADNLFNRGLIPREQFETQAASAAALEATLAADRAQLEQVRLSLQYTRITAPISGRTGTLLAHVGDLVRANDTNALVTINQLSPIDVTFAVPSRLLADIRRYNAQAPLPVVATSQSATLPGAPARTPASQAPSSAEEDADARAASGPSAEGTVTFIDNAIDPATATIKLKATFANRDHNLWPGLFVQVALQLSRQADAVVAPAVAVQASQRGQYVYIVKPDHTVEMRSVVIERQQGEQAIIASGLSGGEEVVTDGQLRLTPGARVTTTRAGSAAP